MGKAKFYILIFSLIVASFSCATVDNSIKDNQNIEKKEEMKEAKPMVEAKEVKEEAPMQSSESPSVQEKVPSMQKEMKKEAMEPPKKAETIEEKNKEKKEEKKEEKHKTNNMEPSPKDEKKHNEAPKPLEKESIKKPVKETSEKAIANEKALQDYNELFPLDKKVETKKEDEKKEEKKSILTSFEILKELDEASNLFQKAPMVAKQHIEKKGKAPKVEAEPLKQNEKIEPPMPEMVAKDEDVSSDEAEAIEVPEIPMEDFNDEHDMLSFNDDQNIFDDEMVNDEQANESFDDFFTLFDDNDERKLEENKSDKNNEHQDNKGQLSSVVDEEDKLNISRYTNILKGQNIDFSYPGEGWVYLGEETSQKGLNYLKRKMEDGKTFFTFTAENEGNYVLNFSYFDVFSGDFIVDAVSVKVLPNNDGVQKDSLVVEYQGKNVPKQTEQQVKKAPNEVNMDADKVGINTENMNAKETNVKEEEKKASPPPTPSNNAVVENNKEMLKPETSSSNKTGNPTYTEPEVFTNVASINPNNAKVKVDDASAKKIIDEVSQAISNGNAKEALEKLEDFFTVASTNMDEAYFLCGKAYELNTELKNIKMALASYKFLTKTFPNSPLWNDADARIRYIEKFFVKIK
ncbi:MAG: hypothetical protein ACTTKH_07745 [Treponema sp.]